MATASAHPRAPGQVIVELALALPLILFVILGGIEAGFLLIAKADLDRTTATIAEWSARHPGESWHAIAVQELPDCDVSVEDTPHDLVEATARCHYSPRVLRVFDGLPMSARAIATRIAPDRPEATPGASPS